MRGDLRREVPQCDCDTEKYHGEDDRQLVDDLLRAPTLHVDRSAAAESLGKTRDAVLQQNAQGEQNGDSSFDNKKDSGHSRKSVGEKGKGGNGES